MSGTDNLPLPARISVAKFAAARLKEIQTMRKNLSENNSTKMAFQKLPKHMRRRAMSHAVKRLPRRIRQIHFNQMTKSGLPPKSKRPSRKYRRRPLNILSDYARRQRRIKWLDTHIWHAKRFHMTEKWGYKLPKQPCDKSFRACYRATTQHCLLQDFSYIRCIEIQGLYEDIIEQLSKVTDGKTGLSFGAKCYSKGNKFGEVTVFEPYFKPLGTVQFFWNCPTATRKLWIFVHPSFYTRFLQRMIKLFDLADGENSSYKGRNVVLTELEHELGKFRLTGPLATCILKKALKIADLSATGADWIKDYPLDTLSKQNEVYGALEDVSHVPANAIVSILVQDPRLNVPKTRTKAMPCARQNDDFFLEFENNLALSPLLDESVRKFNKDSKLTNAQICELRSQFLVPGTEIQSKSIIPVILLRNSGSKRKDNHGYGNGWDIIIPSCWSQSFFMSFIMWGARAGGLRETNLIAFEGSVVDILPPDSAAGEEEERFVEEEFRERFFRLPPNKRPNFAKFKITSPYRLNWKMLTSEWSGSKNDFSVVRDKQLLKAVQEFLTNKKPHLPPLPERGLIPVKIRPINHGIPKKFSIICLPNTQDLNGEPTESKCKDPLEMERYKLRKEHKNILKRYRRRRKRNKLAGKPAGNSTVDIIREYRDKMRKLWLPEAATVKNSCSRPVIGFVKHGDFSFNCGRAKGLGYIVGDVLQELKQCRNKVLFRNCNSRQYRVAVMEVID